MERKNANETELIENKIKNRFSTTLEQWAIEHTESNRINILIEFNWDGGRLDGMSHLFVYFFDSS